MVYKSFALAAEENGPGTTRCVNSDFFRRSRFLSLRQPRIPFKVHSSLPSGVARGLPQPSTLDCLPRSCVACSIMCHVRNAGKHSPWSSTVEPILYPDLDNTSTNIEVSMTDQTPGNGRVGITDSSRQSTGFESPQSSSSYNSLLISSHLSTDSDLDSLPGPVETEDEGVGEAEEVVGVESNEREDE